MLKTLAMPAWMLAALVAVPSMSVFGQEVVSEGPPCTQVEARQFDFWIGHWDITAKSRPPGSEQWIPNDTWIQTHVRTDLSGCVLIEESIDTIGGDTLVVGLSMTSYNRHLGKFQQLWADQKGYTWEYVGEWEDERMVLYLEPTTADGESLVPFEKTTQLRMVFGEITARSLVWRYEYSTDGGRTWTSTHEALYQRRE